MIYPSEFGDDPMFPQTSDFNIEFKNHIAGQGVVCLRDFKQGTVMAHLAGVVVNSMREHSFQIGKNKHLNDEYFTGFFLHSCDPNTAINTKAHTATAIKDIKIGDYITIDYSATEDYLFRQFKCNCGAKKCRGVIAGKKEIPRSFLSVTGYYEDDSDDY
ncbi:hypothetical protein OS175_06895 [Marinicella sp. S1101]|uniref:SET domain-containing protein-lysine N-methyltransferase n=1 Tax=Marinicella marina TaxID=2996016 RepID=UPI002260A7B9|nr:SET domain-containing protein-lysine N-methyltransferase [Marinicella marina]MCX7553602.1 hypothetical protein [Marinicella marina]MDJ1140226.1 hypothetical protein [Marinicella marina]